MNEIKMNLWQSWHYHDVQTGFLEWKSDTPGWVKQLFR